MVWARRLSWISGAFALVLCLGTAYGAYLLADYSWDQVVSYDSPYAYPDRPWDELADEGARASVESSGSVRLVLIIVDGLRLSESRNLMSSVNTLRGYGSDMVATTPQPSLSYPTWTTILSGAPPEISGVTTNWFEGAVPVETLLDVALQEEMKTVVVGPDSFVELYGADRAHGSYFEEWTDEYYMASGFVDKTIDLVDQEDPQLTIVHLPDTDETAHEYGPDSEEYEAVVGRIDSDISRLVGAMQDDRTAFIITADHGHIDGGGHGGWESDVTEVPAVFVGPDVVLDRGNMDQVDIAPTAAAILGMRPPLNSAGRVRAEIIGNDVAAISAGEAQYRDFAERYLDVLMGNDARMGGARSYEAIDVVLMETRETRLAEDRAARLPMALAIATAVFVIVVLIGALSWRALVAAAAGTLGYYVFYNLLYFGIHGHQWSLSAFNTEEYVEAFFNLRMIEAVIAGLVAVVIAAVVYPFLRREPKGARGSYLGSWLSLGPAVVLLVQGTLALQVAWFIYTWGAEVVWRLPDLQWGFKYDLDLIQMTALGAAALLSPLVAFLIGRYHPKVRSAADGGGAPGAPSQPTSEIPAGHGGI